MGAPRPSATVCSGASDNVARTGNPNTAKLPKWPVYSVKSRDTMLFNNENRVEQDPDQGPRLAMEQVLHLS